MVGVEIVLVLVLAEYEILGLMAGRARFKYKVPAPATAGHPVFERYYRVHQNTLEQLMVFVPSLILFGLYVSPRAAQVLGILFLIARLAYAIGYVRDPERRFYGAAPTVAINMTLVLGSLIGLLHAV
jgi:glutathione S-transferase